ncbi:MAG TPA: hypothetical protein VEP89_09960, partial [Draconibacterium sp.]|nr:hypothetical protein [Draconibacterium sp.]
MAKKPPLTIKCGPVDKLCSGSSEIRQSGQSAALKKSKGYLLTRFLVPFDRMQKELPVLHEDKSYINEAEFFISEKPHKSFKTNYIFSTKI